MSYDLWFWKQAPECNRDPSNVMKRLSVGQGVPGIVPIDIESILSQIRANFPDIQEDRSVDTGERVQLLWQAPVDDSCFLVGWSPYHFSVESHGADSDILNKLIDIAIAFDCRLYDPQTNIRYGP